MSLREFLDPGVNPAIKAWHGSTPLHSPDFSNILIQRGQLQAQTALSPQKLTEHLMGPKATLGKLAKNSLDGLRI